MAGDQKSNDQNQRGVSIKDMLLQQNQEEEWRNYKRIYKYPKTGNNLLF